MELLNASHDLGLIRLAVIIHFLLSIFGGLGSVDVCRIKIALGGMNS